MEDFVNFFRELKKDPGNSNIFFSEENKTPKFSINSKKILKDYCVLVKEFIEQNIIHLFDKRDSHIDFGDIGENDPIILEIYLAEIQNFYQDVESFINKNRYELPQNHYYIDDINYFSYEKKTFIIDCYEKNIKYIEMLKSLSVNNDLNKLDKVLTLGNSIDKIVVNINYNFDDIKLVYKNVFIQEFLEDFGNDNIEVRRLLLLNEIIAYINKNIINFNNLIREFSEIYQNYKRSYSLFISGFSYEKIKNNSTQYFHDLTDRIFSTLLKFSSAIFAIPISFVFLVNNYDFKAESFAKDFSLFIISTFLFVMIKWVLVNNVKDGINSVDKDINTFLDRIKNEKDLSTISDKLQQLRDNDVNKQRKRLNIVSFVSWALMVGNFFIFFILYRNELVLCLKSISLFLIKF